MKKVSCDSRNDVTPVNISELGGGELIGKGDTVTYKNKKYLVFQVLGSHAILKGIDDKNDTFIIKVLA